MAVVRVKMIGRGVDSDPYRPPLPTYQELLTNYDEGYVLAYIPDADFHDAPEFSHVKTQRTSRGSHVIELDDAGHQAWHAHLDERYAERKGEFRPEVV